MEFDWTTFALEVLNFLVLVWLLKRFFYRPVLAMIEARRAENAKMIEDAQTLRREAQDLKSEYQARLAAVDKEAHGGKARSSTRRSPPSGRRRLAALEAELTDERKRREAVEARQRSERRACAGAAGGGDCRPLRRAPAGTPGRPGAGSEDWWTWP